MSEIAPSDPAAHPASSPAQADTADEAAPTVLVVDADDRTRASLCGLLAIRSRVRVVADAGRAADAVSRIRALHPDVIVVDPRLPELDGGLAFIRTVRSFDAQVRILAIGPTGPLEAATADAGADAFVRKSFRADELADAIVRCATVIRSAARPEPGLIL